MPFNTLHVFRSQQYISLGHLLTLSLRTVGLDATEAATVLNAPGGVHIGVYDLLFGLGLADVEISFAYESSAPRAFAVTADGTVTLCEGECPDRCEIADSQKTPEDYIFCVIDSLEPRAFISYASDASEPTMETTMGFGTQMMCLSPTSVPADDEACKLSLDDNNGGGISLFATMGKDDSSSTFAFGLMTGFKLQAKPGDYLPFV